MAGPAEWGIEHEENNGTTWLVWHLATRITVADFLWSKRECRRYVASGEAQADLDLILAHRRGEHAEINPDCRECGKAAELAETTAGRAGQ